MVIALILCFLLIDVFITTTIILFEDSSKKIIFWCLICALTTVVGYTIYLIFYSDKGQGKKSLLVKAKEDEIYKKLVGFSIEDKKASNELINFNKKIYGVDYHTNSNLEILKTNEEFNNKLIEDVEKAQKFIIIDTRYFLFGQNKETICYTLKDKAKLGIKVKVIYSRLKKGDKQLIKELKEVGVRCCKFNKFSNVYAYYKNNKNIISIDGETCYLYTHHNYVNKKRNIEYLGLYYRVQGEVVKAIDMDAHLDVSFATQKFYPLENYKTHNIKSGVELQYIASNINNNFLDLMLKAIIEAKKSIVIHVDKFIPNQAILQAIKIAVKSNIEVKLMISNVNHQLSYYTSRSYVKEIARDGVTCYFYDGHIDSNYIIIDNQLVLIGNFSYVNRSITCDLQDILIANDNKLASQFSDYFYDSVNNSYKLCNPKRVLFREKFFRKFM